MYSLLCTKEVPSASIFTVGKRYDVKQFNMNPTKTGGMMAISFNRKGIKQRPFRLLGDKQVESSGYEFTVIVTNKGEE